MERIPSCLLHNSANDDFGRPTVPGSRIPAQGTGLAQGMAGDNQDVLEQMQRQRKINGWELEGKQQK